jgi:hypothetical protein
MTAPLLQSKRQEIKAAVLDAIKRHKSVTKGKMKAATREMKVAELFEEEITTDVSGWKVTDLFKVAQGVTWGGKKCESVFRVSTAQAEGLEPEMVRKTIGGKDVETKKIAWNGNFLVFPYIEAKYQVGNKWVKAFTMKSGNDALDFSKIYDPAEQRQADLAAKLNLRVASGIVAYPKTARYLVNYHDILIGREFEGKLMAEYGKSWYEYHRPRTPELTAKPKIVGKRLMREPSFALDSQGFLPSDSVITLTPKNRFGELKDALRKSLKMTIDKEDALRYALTWLNSEQFGLLLRHKRAKKRGGYPMVDENMLAKFTIPTPSGSRAKVRAIVRGEADKTGLREALAASKKLIRSEQTKLLIPSG